MNIESTSSDLHADMQRLIADYIRGTEEVDAALTAIPADALDVRVDGEWSARMVVHHLADSETNSYVRLRRLLADARVGEWQIAVLPIKTNRGAQISFGVPANLSQALKGALEMAVQNGKLAAEELKRSTEPPTKWRAVRGLP